MVLVLAKCGKISNAQVVRSAIIAVLKRLFQLSSCDNYHEKAVPAIRKSYDSYHEIAVIAVIRQLFALGRNQ